MGLFSGSSPFDEDVDKATDEKNMEENWDYILDVCDKVKAINTGPKDCIRAIFKKLSHPNPHVVKQAVTLLDACVNNCNRPFHLELASREYEQELYRLQKKMHPQVANQLRLCIKKWAENDFRTDPQLSLIPALYNKLKQDGLDFSGVIETVKKAAPRNKDVIAREEEDIAKAIALSLKEAESTSKITSLYPSMMTAPPIPQPVKEPKRVRALYDFEAAEDNELTFKAGEIVHIIDDSDPNWWKGSNQRGEGLFPANFVTSEIESEPEVVKDKHVQFSEEVTVATLDEAPSEADVEIDESKIDRLLHCLHEADPTGERPDQEELKILEEHCTAMAPLIDTELEKLDRRHAHLTKLSADLLQALDLYHSLMRDLPPSAMALPMPNYSYGQGSMVPNPGPLKYPFPQPQAPPQSPSFPPYMNQPPTTYGPPTQTPTAMPYATPALGAPFSSSFPGPQTF